MMCNHHIQLKIKIKNLLVLLSSREGVIIQTDGNSNDSLESVGNRVHNRSLGGCVRGERQSSNLGEGHGELGLEVSFIDVQNSGAEEVSLVTDLIDLKTIGERTDAQLVQKGSLGGANLGTSSDEVYNVGDLDLTLDNLGRDLKHLEERGLSRVTSGGTGRDGNINGGNTTNTCRGGHTVGKDEVTDRTKVFVGEDESNITTHAGLKVGKVVTRVLFDEVAKDLSHHGVLTHENLGTSTHLKTSLVHLERTNIVDRDNEHLGVGVKHLRHALEVLNLLLLRDWHFVCC